MPKLNTVEIQQYNHALKYHADFIKNLNQEYQSGIIIYADIQLQIEMNKKQILDLHKKLFNYWQSQDGRYHSYLPREEVKPPKGRHIESISEEKLNNKIFEYYIEEEKAKKEQEKPCPTFREVYFKWRTIKDLELTGNSIYKYNTDWNRFFNGTDFAEMQINQINENTIRLFMLETIKSLGLCKETCRKFFGYIQNTIRYARIEKIIIDNPTEFLESKDFTRHCEEIEKPDSESYYTDKELAIIMKSLNKYYKNNPTFFAPYAVELAIYTGMRVSELATLQWIDTNDDYISINKSAKHDRLNNEFSVGKTKTKKSRVYPVDKQISSLLQRIKKVQEEQGILCEWIFTDGNGSYTHSRNIGDCLKRICKENNISGGGITKLRKTTSSDLQKIGTSKIAVANMLGHGVETNAKHYTYDTSHLDEKQNAVQNRNAKFKKLAIG